MSTDSLHPTALAVNPLNTCATPGAVPVRPGIHQSAAVELDPPGNGLTLARLRDALDAADCKPRERSNGNLRAFCPICGGGRSKSPALRATVGRSGLVVFTCSRCCPGIDARVDTEARRAILEALDLDPVMLGAAPMPEAVEREIVTYRAALDQAAALGAFKGQAGDTDLRLARTAADFATRARSSAFRGSVRQFALDAGRSRTTADHGLKRLARAGWIKPAAPFGALVDRAEPGGFQSVGRGWVLAIPPHYADTVGRVENGTKADSSTYPGTVTVIACSILSGGSGVARACSTGRAAWRTLEKLLACDGPATAGEIATAAGLSSQTVKKHFAILASMGAAVEVEAGGRGRGNAARWAAVPGALDALGKRGEHLRDAAAATFETERRAYAATFERALADGAHQRVTEDGEIVPPDTYVDGRIVSVRVRRVRRPIARPAVTVGQPDPVIGAAPQLGGIPRGAVPV